MLLTAQTVKLRQPDSVAVGEYYESSEDFLRVADDEINNIWRLCASVNVSSSSYGVINENDRSVAST